tara:strand:- start:154 stop:918 length:765 start_codon:yes stop_codon:yes gene_type:complete
MENYINNYKNFDKIYIYDFRLGLGGIGDYIKYFIILLKECMDNNIKLYQRVNNIEIEKYIKLKYDCIYITISDIEKLNNAVYKYPHHYYEMGEISHKNFNDIDIPFNDVFYFDNSVKLNVINILPSNPINYISIHLRLGDKFLETDKNHVLCKNDIRVFSEEQLYKFIDNAQDQNIIFFCDNLSYKTKIKNKYDNIIITDSQIGHTSLSNTTNKEILDAITEFYIMSNSELIYGASNSGFSIVASLMNNVKYIS